MDNAHLIDLAGCDPDQLEALAALSHAAALGHSPGWLPAMTDARDEVREALAPGKIARVAVDGAGRPLGWIAAAPSWGRVWELHPLLVDPAHHRHGLGRRLVEDLEPKVAARGAMTLILGTSDLLDATTASGVDLYPDPLAVLAAIAPRKEHAFQFWRRLGYTLVGVIPDAEGWGRPSLQLAKRLADR